MAKILVVDDEELVRHTLVDFLSSVGHRVDQTGDGRQALQLLEDDSYDLVVTDVIMPDFDGIELIRSLSERKEELPIIAISGGGGVFPPNWSIKMTEVFGVKHSLTKPIDFPVLVSAVESALTDMPKSHPA